MSVQAEILAQMAVSIEVEHHLDKFAKEVADYAKSIAPVFGDQPPKRGEPGIGEPGDYRDSIAVERIAAKVPTRRVISRDPKAIWIELGSRHMPEYAVLAKTAAYFGETGPVIDEGVEIAQGKLREGLEKLAKLSAVGAAAHEVTEAERAISAARQARSSAFKAARGPRRRR